MNDMLKGVTNDNGTGYTAPIGVLYIKKAIS